MTNCRTCCEAPELEVSGWLRFVLQYQPYLEGEPTKVIECSPTAELNGGWEVVELREHHGYVELKASKMKLAADGELAPISAIRVAFGRFLVGADGANRSHTQRLCFAQCPA
jgi:hypothetical protein